MICPACHAPESKCIIMDFQGEKVNEHGRLELSFEAQHHEFIHWEKDHFHCSNCNLDFSFMEGVNQRLKNQISVKESILSYIPNIALNRNKETAKGNKKGHSFEK